MNKVNTTDFKPSQILSFLPFFAFAIENIQSFEGGNTIIRLSVAVREAVCEGGEEAKAGTEYDK